MILLIIDGKVADFAADGSIDLVRRSSLFAFDEAQGSFSINFDLPYKYSARNQLIFKFVGTPRSIGATEELPYELYFRGSLVARGTLIAKQTSENVSCNVLFENGEFNDLVAKKTLQDLSLGFLSLDTEQSNYSDNDELVAWAFFQNKAQFTGLFLAYDEDGDGITQDIEDCNVRYGSVLQTSDNDINTGAHRKNFTNCPQIFVKPLLKEIYRQYGFFLEYSFFELPEFQNIALFSPYDLNGYFWRLVWGEEYKRRLEEFANLTSVLPQMELKEFFFQLFGFFCAGHFFQGNKVRIYLHADVINNDYVYELPDSFKLTSLSTNEIDGYKISFETPSQDSFYDSWKELSKENVEIQLLDLEEHYFFGKSLSFDLLSVKNVKYYLNTANYYLYGKGESLFNSKGIASLLAKPELVTKGTDLQPITEGAEGFTHTVKAGAMGNHENYWAVNVPNRNSSYEETEIKDLRFGFVVNNAKDGEIARFQSRNHAFDLQYWTLTVGGDKTFWQRCWKPYVDWVQYRKAVEAEVSGEDAWLFLQSWSADKKYVDRNGNRYIFTEITSPLGQNKIGTVKIKGWTVW